MEDPVFRADGIIALAYMREHVVSGMAVHTLLCDTTLHAHVHYFYAAKGLTICSMEVFVGWTTLKMIRLLLLLPLLLLMARLHICKPPLVPECQRRLILQTHGQPIWYTNCMHKLFHVLSPCSLYLRRLVLALVADDRPKEDSPSSSGQGTSGNEQEASGSIDQSEDAGERQGLTLHGIQGSAHAPQGDGGPFDAGSSDESEDDEDEGDSGPSSSEGGDGDEGGVMGTDSAGSLESSSGGEDEEEASSSEGGRSDGADLGIVEDDEFGGRDEFGGDSSEEEDGEGEGLGGSAGDEDSDSGEDGGEGTAGEGG